MRGKFFNNDRDASLCFVIPQHIYIKSVVFYAVFEQSEHSCLLIMYDVLSHNTWSRCWCGHRRLKLRRVQLQHDDDANQIVLSGRALLSIEGTMSLRCCWAGDYGIFVNITWCDLDQSHAGILPWGITNHHIWPTILEASLVNLILKQSIYAAHRQEVMLCCLIHFKVITGSRISHRFLQWHGCWPINPQNLSLFDLKHITGQSLINVHPLSSKISCTHGCIYV